MRNITFPILFTATFLLLNACSTAKHPATKNATPQKENIAKSNILLSNGQKVTVTTTGSSDSDMGMGMQMKNTTSAVNLFKVIATDDSSYVITNTLTKMKMSMNMMGQETNYDSEKPGDKDSEIGKGISTKLNQADTLSVNKMSASVVKRERNTSPERAEENPLMGMMAAMGVSSAKDPSMEAAFFIIPKDKKMGESWSDSSTEKSIKTVKIYTLKSIVNNIATIIVNSTLTGTGETEMQGTAVAFTMNTKNTGEIIVDTKSSLVSKIVNDANVSMTMDVMGQSMPVTSKTSSTIVYQY
ncbi:MAG: hypothetical protein H7258_12485 [Ferruginibacter sp.]|nr:hypothetical protein [Ferruginibacter sp.]